MTRARPVVAIDGPVGAGKSSVARELARALKFDYVNTGAMYRAVALAAARRGIGPETAKLEAGLRALLGTIRIGFRDGHLLLDGEDVTEEVAAPEIGELASRLSTLEVVREKMRELQRAAGEAGGIVMEGRDIGTAVFPDAEFKFFLDAAVEERARRRFEEHRARGVAISLKAVMAQLVERDRRDRGRKLAPLSAAPDAVVIDSTRLSVGEVVALMKARIEAGGERAHGT